MQWLKRAGGLLLVIATIVWSPWTVAGPDKDYTLDLKLRFMHYDRDFENKSKDRAQNGAGITAHYISLRWLDVVRLGLSGQISVKGIADSLQKTDVLFVENNHARSHAVFAESYLEFLPISNASIKLGRQQHKSMLLRSKTRILPSTFQGVSAYYQPEKALKLYGAVYNKWSPRASPDFEQFDTDLTENGAIDYVMLFGTQYRLGDLRVHAEYLRSDDYLSKLGIKTNYDYKLDQNKTVEFKAGLFGLYDAGQLFATGADDGVLDTTTTGVVDSYNSVAAYVGTALHYQQSEFGLYYTKVGNAWLEDNFAGDHGANPFPANTIGPDLTNKNESVWVVEYKQKWHPFGVPNLKTRIAYAYGGGAENTISRHLGHGSEQWLETDIHYQFVNMPALKTRLRYRAYRSDETGSVKGIKEDQNDLRFTVDYTYHFQ